jgi:ABC-type lipoprotein export system ATPase subunit
MLISLRNLEKSYPQGPGQYYVLRQITLDIKEGEFVSIMGPSGAGKSTLLHILGMHDHAWTGEYHFLDQPVHRMSAKQRAQLHKQHIGFVFQSYQLLDDLTVYENLDVPLSYPTSRGRSARAWWPTPSTAFRLSARRTCIPISCLEASSSWWRSRAP